MIQVLVSPAWRNSCPCVESDS